MITGEARSPNVVRAVIEEYRRKLLDLGGRNRFLNFAHRETARTQVRLVDTSLQAIFDLLVQERDISFVGIRKPVDLEPITLEEAEEEADAARPFARKRSRAFDPEAVASAAQAQGVNPDYDLASGAQKSPGQKFQTLLFEEPLKTRLQAIHDEAKRFIQELGINTLCCSLGFLEWYESDSSDRARFAPLLIVPIEMKRTLVSAKYQFHVHGLGEEPQNNPSLLERIVADFGIRLPSYEPDQTVRAFLEAVEGVIKGQKRWKVRPMATISLLNFAKLALYNDLDVTQRPSHAQLEDQSVLMDLICGTDASEPSSIGAEENVDAASIVSRVPLLVTEADASQFAAIADAMAGRSMVIEGPPGTGKSQTITNIIAAALAKGERVLFVAEKLAALDVVKSKLDSYGLGDFCLELHSTKARKTDVHLSLKRRLNRGRERERDRSQVLADLNQQKAVIQSYLDSLHANFGKLGSPLHDLVWREQRMRLELPDSAPVLEDILVPSALDYDDAGISAASQKLAGYESIYRDVCGSYGAVANHPWNGVNSAGLKLQERQSLITVLRNIEHVLDQLNSAVSERMRSAGLLDSYSLNATKEFAALTLTLPPYSPDIEPSSLVAMASPDGLAVAERFMKNVGIRTELRATYPAGMLDRLAPISAELLALLAHPAIGDENLALYDIPDRAHALSNEAGELDLDRRHLRQIVERLGVLRGDDLVVAVEMAKLLESTPRRVLAQRSPMFLAEESAFDARATCVAGSKLAVERTALQDGIDLQDLPPSSELRSMARTLREAGPFWIFKASVRSARAFFRQRIRVKTILSNGEIAEKLTEISEHIDRLAAFIETRARFVGELFDGLQTDFDFVQSIVSFGDAVRYICKGVSEGSQVQNIATTGALVDVDAFIRLLQDPRTMRLLGVDLSDWDNELAREGQQIRETASLLRSLESKAASADISKGLRLFELREVLQAALKHTEYSMRIAGDGAAKKIFEASFATLCEDCSPIQAAITYLSAVDSANIPNSIKRRLRMMPASERDTLIGSIAEYWGPNMAAVEAAAESMGGQHVIDNLAFFGELRPADRSICDLRSRLSYALNAADSLEEWLRFEAVRQLATEAAGAKLIEVFEAGLLGESTPLSSAFVYCIIRTVVRLAIDEDPNLRGLAGVALNEARQRFQQLDARLIELGRTQLAAVLDRVYVDPGNGVGRKSGFTGKSLINLEVQKMKRHVAIRDLVQRAGLALQQLKPCFMMSPLSVAQYIPPGAIEFDLVVIDEASQMRPEDSLAALSRAKRAIIVGDQKQLPPTAFFERTVDDDDVADEDAVDNESVLDLALGQYGQSRRLRWHYRSRHESLIAFSNRHFYDDDLIVLPSPHDAMGDLGVRSTFVESTYSKGRNLGEAEAVVDAVLRFMRKSVDHSVGVVAINREQRELIQELLDRAIAQDEAARRYVAAWEGTLYPYFVKNLESVQGDERDVMFISTVYGPETIGGRVAQRFGPILGASGWRRLNVLFTRARVRVELYTSMRPSDVTIEDGRSRRGVAALRNYLEYARGGRLESGDVGRRSPDSDFEIAVGRMLEARGYEVVPQVGVDKYYIDLAVRHPRHGGFILGIECDGASYHSSRSARDRDRTREEALQGLGWSLYRIWSTDWFASPMREIAKLDNYLKSLFSGAA